MYVSRERRGGSGAGAAVAIAVPGTLGGGTRAPDDWVGGVKSSAKWSLILIPYVSVAPFVSSRSCGGLRGTLEG